MNTRLALSLLSCFLLPFLGSDSGTIQAQIEIPQAYTLANGLKVFVVENRKLPQVSFSLHVNYEPVPEGAKAGTLQLLGEMLESGTDSLTQDSAWKEIEFWGAEVSFHSQGFTAYSLSRYTPNLFQILAQMVTSPAFTAEELEKRKRNMLATFTLENATPSLIRDRVGKSVTYGSDHPFGELANPKTLKAITVEDIQKAYGDYFQPGISHLVVVGDVRAEEVWEWAEKHFGDWNGRTSPTHSLRSPSPPEKREVAFVYVPGEYQTYFKVANPILLRRGDTDEFGALVANYSLGMSFLDSHLIRNKYAGEFSIDGQEPNYQVIETIQKILNEIQQLRTDSLESVKLEFAKSQLIDRFDIQKTTPTTIGTFAHILETNDLPQEYFKHYTKYLEAVTAEDVLQASQKYIKPDQAYIVVVSSDSTLSEKLSQFGPVTRYEPSGKPFDVFKEEPIPKGLEPQAIIDRYLSEIGGESALAVVKNYKLFYEGKIKGDNLTLKIQKRKQGLMSSQVEAGLFVQKTIFNGQKGMINSSKGGLRSIEGGKLASMRFQAALFPELLFDAYDYDLRLKRIVQINGNRAYEMEVTDPAGAVSTYYFDKATGLKIRKSTHLETEPGRPEIQIINYGDYRSVEGIKFPYKLSQQVGPEALEMNAVSVEVNGKMKKREFRLWKR